MAGDDADPLDSYMNQIHEEVSVLKRKEAEAETNTLVLQKKTKLVLQEESLKVPIPESNVGYKLLQKMGFTPGTGLGKDSKGRVDPVPISLKADKMGLGKDTELKAKREEKRVKHESERKVAVSVYIVRIASIYLIMVLCLIKRSACKETKMHKYRFAIRSTYFKKVTMKQ